MDRRHARRAQPDRASGRSPVAAPAEVHGDASASGSQAFYGHARLHRHPPTHGLRPRRRHADADSVTTGAFDIDSPGGRRRHQGLHGGRAGRARAARGSRSDSADDTADLDLFVYKGGDARRPVGVGRGRRAGDAASTRPPARTTCTSTASHTGGLAVAISNFVVPSGSAGNAFVTPNPAPVTTGVPVTLTANWTGLDTAKRWFGVINYTGTTNITFFSVN